MVGGTRRGTAKSQICGKDSPLGEVEIDHLRIESEGCKIVLFELK